MTSSGVSEAGADAAWAAMCERTPGTTRHVDEAIEWKQAVAQIIEDALPALEAEWELDAVVREQLERTDAEARADQLEATLERYREALEEIANSTRLLAARRIARAALDLKHGGTDE